MMMMMMMMRMSMAVITEVVGVVRYGSCSSSRLLG